LPGSRPGQPFYYKRIGRQKLVIGSKLTDGEKKQLSRATLNFLANGAPEGERNSTLFKVFSDFAGCGYDREYTKATVLPVCTRIGLAISEFEQVLNHAYSIRLKKESQSVQTD
jgi:hypothetical protein